MFVYGILSVFTVFCHGYLAQRLPSEFNPDINFSTAGLIEKYGYPLEIHETTTEDGYMLNFFRIPHGRNSTGVNQKPILLMHGLMAHAASFIIAGLNGDSLAYHLANNGYDVWLGNCRGTEYGRRHRKFNTTSKKFWKFSFHEIGMYDLPSMVDYILEKTGKVNLYYIGYSQGATIFYVLNSLKPQYRQKFAQASLMAPVASMKHFDHALLLPLVKRHEILFDIFEKGGEVMFPLPWMNFTAVMLMPRTENGPLVDLCLLGIKLLLGNELFDSKLYGLFARFMQSSSLKQFRHFAQTVNSGRFRQYDYGKQQNIRLYGMEEPPDYPVEDIDIPIALYYSLGDQLNKWQNVEAMCAKLPKCTRKFQLKNEKIGHIDFIASVNLTENLNGPMVDYMNTYDISDSMRKYDDEKLND